MSAGEALDAAWEALWEDLRHNATGRPSGLAIIARHRPLIEAASRDPADPEHPEATCERCGRPNAPTWHAPSPLWNAVLRDPATGADAFSVLCPPCFAELAEARGLRYYWHFGPHADVAALWTDRDGRAFDAGQCMWVDPPDVEGAVDAIVARYGGALDALGGPVLGEEALARALGRMTREVSEPWESWGWWSARAGLTAAGSFARSIMEAAAKEETT